MTLFATHVAATTRAPRALVLAALALVVVSAGLTAASPASALASSPSASSFASSSSAPPSPRSAPAADAGRATFGAGPASGSGPDGRSAFSYDVTRGAHLTDRLAVVNLTDQPVDLAVYPVDARPDDQGGAQLPPAGVAPVAAGSWFHLSLASPTSVPVAAHSTVILPFTVEVPAGASPGDHEAALIASLSSYAVNRQGTRVRVDQRLAVRAYLRVAGPLTPRLQIQQLHVSYHAGSNPFRGTVTASYLVRNTGNVRLGAVQQVAVHELFGATATAHGLHALPVLQPGAGQRVSVRLTGVIAEVHGRVQITLHPVAATGDVDGALTPVEASQGVWTVPWVVLAALVLLIVVLVVVRRWRRRRSGPAHASPSQPAGSREVVHA